MAELVALTLLMGLLLIGLLVAIPRLGARGNQRFSRRTSSGRQEEPSDLFTRIGDFVGGIAARPTTWYLGFFLLALGLAGGAIFFVSAPDISTTILDGVGMAIAGVLGLLLIAFLFFGTYLAVRGRGRGNAEATLVGFSVLGTVLMATIVALLVLG